jgi:hypothetical protein
MSQAMDSSTTGRSITTMANSRLYAFLLKLRPLQQGTLMSFNGELMHEGNKRQLFTCSNLQ